jgi:YgiT-type zinc finger domain-containing protein
MEEPDRKDKMSYGDCIYCGGVVSEKKERLDYRHHGQLFIIENVPVGVCHQCGEQFFTAKIAKALETAASTSNGVTKTVMVPVISIAA